MFFCISIFQKYDNFQTTSFLYIKKTQKGMACFQAFNNMCRKIVCPTRHQLDEDQIIQRKFRSSHVKYELFDVKNSHGQMLSVVVFQKSFSACPTILYLHGNGGHKLQSLQIAFEQINLIALDFCGCGKSQGQFVTYGQKQVQDIRMVVVEIMKLYKIRKFALWGRSMGASLAMMYTAKYPREVYSLILDTPFRFLKKVVYNVAEQNSRSFPGFLISLAVFFVQMKTQDLVGSKIFENDFSKCLENINIPILFTYSTRDSVVKQQDVKELFNLYKGIKSLHKIQSLHHQDRPRSFIDSGYQFIIDSIKNSQKQVHSLKDSKYSYSKKAFIKQSPLL